MMETTMDTSSSSSSETQGSLSPTAKQVHLSIKAAKNPQDLLTCLAFAANHLDHHDVAIHDGSISSGMVSTLSKALRKILVVKHSTSRRSYYRSSLGLEDAMSVSLLCSLLEMVLVRCSASTLELYLDKLLLSHNKLVASLIAVIRIFRSWDECCAIREVAISKCARIIHRLSTVVEKNEEELALVSLALCKAEACTETRIDVSLALINFVSRRSLNLHLEQKVMAMASVFVSTLTTAALSSSCAVLGEGVATGLERLVEWSDEVRVKMAKRRDTVRALTSLMTSRDVHNRRAAYQTAKRLLSCNVSLVQLLCVNPHGGTAILRGLGEALVRETVPILERLVGCILRDAIANMNSSLSIFGDAIEILRASAFSSAALGVREMVAVALCKKSCAVEANSEVGSRLLYMVTELVSFPSNKVRAPALDALLQQASRKETSGVILADMSNCRHALSEVLRHGIEPDERSKTIQIIRNLSRQRQSRCIICQDTTMLSLLVHMVTDYHANNNLDCVMTHVSGIETLLMLLSDEENIRCFLQFPSLLPWLANFANTTTSDDKLKKNAINAIVELSKTYLLESKKEKQKQKQKPADVHKSPTI